MDDYESKPKAIITTIRHGEKDKDGALTERGRQQAAERGDHVHYLQGDIILLHSGVTRVKDTLESFAKHLNLKEDISSDALKNEFNFQSYTSQYLQYVYDSKNKGELFGSWDSVEGREAEEERMAKFLSQNNVSSEPEIYPSPKQMAIRLARVIATQIDFATITVPEVRTNFVNGSHEPVIMSFLYYFLQDFNPSDSLFLQKIGGSVDFTEGFGIYIYDQPNGSNKVIFKFRDIEKEMDQVKLKEFCLSENVH
ncbi:MAG: histidine phosphatase family protein [Candidatus Dojkabacteria bacterium]